MSDEEMSEADLKAEVEHAQWAQDMAVEEAVNAARPDPSPVCVEVKGLEWKRFVPDHPPLPNEYVAETGVARYRIAGPLSDGKWHLRARLWASGFSNHHFPKADTLEAAQAACDADHERRTLELVNARSVESVKAERDRELIEIFAAKTQEIDQSDENGRALALSYINAVQCLRSLTEGEG